LKISAENARDRHEHGRRESYISKAHQARVSCKQYRRRRKAWIINFFLSFLVYTNIVLCLYIYIYIFHGAWINEQCPMMEAVQSRSTTTACGEYTPTRTPKTQRERERERENYNNNGINLLVMARV
jgi:hypothetical protein